MTVLFSGVLWMLFVMAQMVMLMVIISLASGRMGEGGCTAGEWEAGYNGEQELNRLVSYIGGRWGRRDSMG